MLASSSRPRIALIAIVSEKNHAPTFITMPTISMGTM